MQATPCHFNAILLTLLFALRFLCFPFLDHCLRRRQPGDGHTKRRRADVVHAHFVAEPDAWRISTVLAADTDFQLRTHGASALSCPPNQERYAVDIESLKWI